LGFAQFYYGYDLKMVGRKAEAQAAFQNAQKVGTGTVKTAAAQQLSELNR